jgi:hypothetical protein
MLDSVVLVLKSLLEATMAGAVKTRLMLGEGHSSYSAHLIFPRDHIDFRLWNPLSYDLFREAFDRHSGYDVMSDV